MARISVTLEQVARAVETLRGRGVPITLRAVRAELGAGSYSTLAGLLEKLHARQ